MYRQRSHIPEPSPCRSSTLSTLLPPHEPCRPRQRHGNMGCEQHPACPKQEPGFSPQVDLVAAFLRKPCRCKTSNASPHMESFNPKGKHNTLTERCKQPESLQIARSPFSTPNPHGEPQSSEGPWVPPPQISPCGERGLPLCHSPGFITAGQPAAAACATVVQRSGSTRAQQAL